MIPSRVTTSTHHGPGNTRTSSISAVAEEGQIELISQKLAQNGINGHHLSNGLSTKIDKEHEMMSTWRPDLILESNT